jgi:hypothetical protein
VGDGHCIYRSIGKILQKQPGEMMQEVRAHMLGMNSCTEYYLVDRELAKRESRYTAMTNVRHNKRGVKIHETEWGEPEDLRSHSKMERERCNSVAYGD